MTQDCRSPSQAELGASQDAPLHGITVVDLTRVLAGPYCTMMLADLGARVIKVEDPDGGDDSRRVGPFVDGESVYFASINRGKESVALDLKSAEGRAFFERLVARADVLVENFRPGVMQRLGYGWEALHAKHPALIYASISGFGQTGPMSRRPAYDMVVQAMGGIMSITGETDGRPVRVGISIGDIAAGLYATIGVQAALAKRTRTGLGDRIDISMLDCQLALLENPIARFSATGKLPQPLGARHSSITPFDVFKTADGFLAVAAGNDSIYRTLCMALDRPDLANDPRFVSLALRNEHHDVLKEIIESRLMARRSQEWSEIFDREGVPHGLTHSVAAHFDSEQVKARNMLVSMPIGQGQEIRVASNPVKLESYNFPLRVARAPELDRDRTSVFDARDVN